ncbi:MAG TPA: hypothetical protein PKX48_14935 [Planctomycetota bacterium]|jgi:preprotein translocase subunit SecY|nr:hypothetical protein [Planctomycetota bacterium]OQC19391.1 MAG: hypothetical protein BWX69_02741 [Planctomycetes bacterium ADurb.Bin069]NMD36987.1 hypothetical protein [Planctomycetota bacterium]HNS00574.1 hypothetical protein [Planctomycetota bacterium]HNU27417.1 hypothetical protein [Planctomycetota bacterium]
MNTLNSLLCRVFVAGAFVLLVLAVLEKVLNLCGYALLKDFYTPGRLLEFAGVGLLFVVVMLLRQIREEVKKKP